MLGDLLEIKIIFVLIFMKLRWILLKFCNCEVWFKSIYYNKLVNEVKN